MTEASQIPEALAKAFYIARSGRPGPVLIGITKNAQLQQFEFPEYRICHHIRSYRPAPVVRREYVQQVAELINKAKRPFVLWGQGVTLGEAEQEFRAFIEKSGIPAAWTILGAGALPTGHPLNVGMLGMHGNYGQGVAYASQLLGLKGYIFMPANTPAQKVSKVRLFGQEQVEVILTGSTFDDTFQAAR